MATWVLTGGIENFRINAGRGFDVVGFKERRRRQALEIEPGDEIVFYVTKYADSDGEPRGQAFGAIATVTSELFEDRAPIWPQGKKKYPEEYPWRVEADPLIVLDEGEFVPAVALVDQLEHTSRWPAEHWHLAFQGQLRTVSAADAELIADRMAGSRTAAH